MLYLAIDGGGTKTEGLLTDGRGAILAHRTVGPSNPNDISMPVAVSVLARLTYDLLAEAIGSPDLPPTEVSFYAGISGVLSHRAAMLDALKASLEALSDRLPVRFSRIALESDVTILLAAEIPEGNGACIISGTGSACFVRHNGLISRIGGWGYLLDRGGSGYDIGRDALEAVLRAHDGRGEPTTLTDLLARHFGKPVPDAISEIYADGKTAIAACAPFVFSAAEAGDSVAQHILDGNARALAELIATAARLVGADTESRPLPVIMGGGLCQGRPDWVARVASHIPATCSVTLKTASEPPVMGALTLAKQNADQI